MEARGQCVLAVKPGFGAHFRFQNRYARLACTVAGWSAPAGGVSMRTELLSAALLCLLGCPLVRAAPPLPTEHLTLEKLGPANPHWIYAVDEAFFNETDARVDLFDGDSYRRLGQIDAGFMPGVNLSPDGSTTVVATTYFARGGHGARTDVVEFTDNSTLSLTGEIVLPPKRANTLPTYFNLAYSADSHFLYVAYVTPASSFGVLDPAKRPCSARSIPPAACWSSHPALIACPRCATAAAC